MDHASRSARTRFQIPVSTAILNQDTIITEETLQFNDARGLEDGPSYNLIEEHQCDQNAEEHSLLCYLHIASGEYIRNKFFIAYTLVLSPSEVSENKFRRVGMPLL